MIQQPFYSNQWYWVKRWIDSFRYSYSSALEISYLWSSDIEEYSIPSKCRNVEERLILLITATINYQTHPIWFIIKLINPWIVTHWLTIEHMIDRLLDWLNGESNLISIPIQSDSIHSSFISVIIQFSSIFLCSDWFLFNKAKSISYFSINDCIALSIYWTMDSQMWIITNKYQSIRSIPLCHCQIQSSWLFEATSLLSILNKS